VSAGMLGSQQEKVQLRALGALHNLSSDADAIRMIRKAKGIPTLVGLLRCCHSTGCYEDARPWVCAVLKG
jgi:hypothetical protein